MVNASIVGIGSAAPDPISQEVLWEQHFAQHFSDDRRARAIFGRSGVTSRGGCVVPMNDDVSGWGTEQRMRRFIEEAVPLARTAIERCLADAQLRPDDIELLTAVSCTGYATPGIDALLARDLAMPASTQRLHVGHMGCYAALPGLAAVSDAAVARGKVGVMVCVELASLHIQEPTDDIGQIVAHALFADAAAAVAVAPGAGLGVVDVVARTDADHASHMTWDVTDKGFRMGLSPEVPRILSHHLRDAVEQLLGAHDLTVPDIAAWAVHPGGPKILDVVGDELGLGPDDLQTSRDVLAEHGNTSSATVLLILERIVTERQMPVGDKVVCLAFGPGLTLYATLLIQRE